MVGRQQFRDGMARFAAAVTVITTDGPTGLAGLTATAVAAVSDDPPTLLACVNRQGHSNRAIRANGAFCVNLLAADQHQIAVWFSGRGGLPITERFARTPWHPIETGAPALDAAIVAFDCRVQELCDVGTHTVIFGRVVAIREGEDRSVLLYSHRGYRVLDLATKALKAAE